MAKKVSQLTEKPSTGANTKVVVYDSSTKEISLTPADAVGGSGSGSMTGAAIKTAYEAEADTNAFTDSRMVIVDSVTSSLSDKVDKANSLGKNNTDSYMPTSDYHPATKKYVDDKGVAGFIKDVVAHPAHLTTIVDTTLSPLVDDVFLVRASIGSVAGGDLQPAGLYRKKVGGWVYLGVNQSDMDLKADKSNTLELDNTISFTPSSPYHPATKKYVDEVASGLVKGVVSTPAHLITIVDTSLNPVDYDIWLVKLPAGTVSGGDFQPAGLYIKTPAGWEHMGIDQADMDLKADKSNALELDNATTFTPTMDYHPATKKYVDDNAAGTGNVINESYGPTWDNDTTNAASRGSVYSELKDLNSQWGNKTIGGLLKVDDYVDFLGVEQAGYTIQWGSDRLWHAAAPVMPSLGALDGVHVGSDTLNDTTDINSTLTWQGSAAGWSPTLPKALPVTTLGGLTNVKTSVDALANGQGDIGRVLTWTGLNWRADILPAQQLLLDEDNFWSNSSVNAPTQQSVKVYVDKVQDNVNANTDAINANKENVMKLHSRFIVDGFTGNAVANRLGANMKAILLANGQVRIKKADDSNMPSGYMVQHQWNTDDSGGNLLNNHVSVHDYYNDSFIISVYDIPNNLLAATPSGLYVSIYYID